MAEFIEGAIRDWALDDPGITAMISGRWWGEVFEQPGTYPAVTVQVVSSLDGSPTHQGHSGREQARVQITGWTVCQVDAQRLSIAIRRRFDNAYFGGGLDCLAQHINTVSMGRAPGQKVYQRASDYRVFHRLHA